MDFKYCQLSSSCHIQVSYDGFHFDQNHMHFFKHVFHFDENGGHIKENEIYVFQWDGFNFLKNEYH